MDTAPPSSSSQPVQGFTVDEKNFWKTRREQGFTYRIDQKTQDIILGFCLPHTLTPALLGADAQAIDDMAGEENGVQKYMKPYMEGRYIKPGIATTCWVLENRIDPKTFAIKEQNFGLQDVVFHTHDFKSTRRDAQNDTPEQQQLNQAYAFTENLMNYNSRCTVRLRDAQEMNFQLSRFVNKAAGKWAHDNNIDVMQRQRSDDITEVFAMEGKELTGKYGYAQWTAPARQLTDFIVARQFICNKVCPSAMLTLDQLADLEEPVENNYNKVYKASAVMRKTA